MFDIRDNWNEHFSIIELVRMGASNVTRDLFPCYSNKLDRSKHAQDFYIENPLLKVVKNHDLPSEFQQNFIII